MKTPDEILTEISQLSNNLELAFGLPSQIREDYFCLQNIENKLVNIQREITPFAINIKQKIEEINVKNATKAIAGLVLMAMGSDSDDDSSWFDACFDSILSDFGEHLLDQSMKDYLKYNVKDEAGLKRLYDNLVYLQQILETKINQVNILKYIAESCYTNQEISKHLEQDKYSFNFAKIKDLFNQLLIEIKFNFTFNKYDQLLDEISSWKQSLSKLNKIQKKVNQFHQFLSTENKNNINISSQLILTILSFFGDTVTYVRFDQQGDLIWIISSYPYSFNDLLINTKELSQYCDKTVNLVLKLEHTAKNCLHNQNFLQLLKQPPQGNNLQLLKTVTEQKFQQNQLTLKLDLLETLPTKLEEFNTVCQEVKSLNLNLKTLTNKYQKKSDFPFNSSSITALISLFGVSLESISFSNQGILTLTIESINYDLLEFLETCLSFSEYLQNNLVKRIYLIKLTEQIINNSKLTNLIKETNPSLSVEQFFINLETQRKKLVVKFTFEQRNKLKNQVDELTSAIKIMQQIITAFKQITNCQDELTFNSLMLEKYIFLFGLITIFGFNKEGKLYLIQNNQSYLISELQKRCNSLLPKLEKELKKAEESLQLAQNCLTDETLRQNTIKQQQTKRKQKIALATIASLLVISPLGWLGYNWSYSRWILWEVSQLQTNGNTEENIDQLKTQQKQLETAINNLSTIKNYPASSYQEAQKQIFTLQTQLDRLNSRILLEEKASQNLTDAMNLATEAEQIFKNANNQLNQLIEAQTKLQKAIEILQVIPPSTLVTDQAMLILKSYQDQTNQISQTSKVLQDFQNSEKLALEASEMVKNPPHPVETWQLAKTKWQEAIKLLSNVAQQNIATGEIKEKLKTYQNNYQIINNRLAQENRALSNYNQALSLAQKISKMVENPPHPLNTWKQALNQCNQTITLLQSIPNQTVIYPESQLKLNQYQATCANLNNRLKSEENALNLIIYAQRLEKEVLQSLSNNSYTIPLLNQLLAKMKQAQQQLQKIPSGMAVSNKAQALLTIYQENMEALTDKIEDLEVCQEYNLSYCFEAEYPIYWKSYNDN